MGSKKSFCIRHPKAMFFQNRKFDLLKKVMQFTFLVFSWAMSGWFFFASSRNLMLSFQEQNNNELKISEEEIFIVQSSEMIAIVNKNIERL